MLGAGKGTRLRPLTNSLPKPLVPLFHKPLVEWSMEACRDAGITDFAINTHPLPEAWTQLVTPAGDGQPGTWNACPVSLFHERMLLETGGGIRNIANWVGDDQVLVHNGDIFSTIDLKKLMAAHQESGDVVTLALRSSGPALQIAVVGNRVVDIRGALGRGPGTHLFTGIYCFSPALIDLIPPHEKISVIPAFLELARTGHLGAVVLDEGYWCDLGDQESYLNAHRDLALAEPVHPTAQVANSAIVERSVIGPRARIGDGAIVKNSVIWPDVVVASNREVIGQVVI